jgi:hypothetical protein
VVGLIASAALLAAGCGAQPHHATQAAPARWAGPALLKALGRLPNYSSSTSMLESYGIGTTDYEQASFHAGGADREVITGKAAPLAFMGATSLIVADGHYYLDITIPPAQGFAAGWYDLGTKRPQAATPYADALTNFTQYEGGWLQLLRGSTAKAMGGCSAVGRKGTLWRVRFQLPAGTTASGHAYGTACVDQRTGAPLRMDLSYHGHDISGQPVSFEDHFQVTAVGTVPAILPPKNPMPAPKVSFQS